MGLKVGVNFPVTRGGKRSTTATGKRIVAAALEAAGRSDAATAVDAEKNWRFGYQKHFVQLLLAMGSDTATALAMAQAGLAEARNAFEFVSSDGSSVPLVEAVGALGTGACSAGKRIIHTGLVHGQGKFVRASIPEVPFEGRTYRGKEIVALARKLAAQDKAEASFAASVAEAVEHPEWFDLRGRVFVLIGATSEMGPLEPLLACGATCVAIARPNSRSKPDKWQTVIKKALASPGTLVLPLSAPQSSVDPSLSVDVDGLAALAGVDATAETPELITWLASDGVAGMSTKGGEPMALYSGIYLDGEGFVRASVAMDAIVDGVGAKTGTKPTLCYIDTPSHVHLVPSSFAGKSQQYRSTAPVLLKLLGACGLAKPNSFTTVTGNQGRDVLNALATAQGPNYATARPAKILQRWRAILARASGSIVSITNGPPGLTDSVMHNKQMAFLMTEINNVDLPPFDGGVRPESITPMMAIVLVRDISSRKAAARPEAKLEHCLDLCAENAWHGGMWNGGHDFTAVGYYVYARYYGARVLLPLLLVLAVAVLRTLVV